MKSIWWEENDRSGQVRSGKVRSNIFCRTPSQVKYFYLSPVKEYFQKKFKKYFPPYYKSVFQISCCVQQQVPLATKLRPPASQLRFHHHTTIPLPPAAVADPPAQLGWIEIRDGPPSNLRSHQPNTQTPGKFQKLGQMSPPGSFTPMYSHHCGTTW